ncbi:thioredoxin family protein [Bacillus sp. FJAT-27251]|uniref:thioredoxin family protein n=1 Tax=Bacillus sp. FJAT-27251 TaxID=1684142 RepID=UPI0006A7E19F|nr:thioredoxin family protein [Bacillus sp. FJAT-27251]
MKDWTQKEFEQFIQNRGTGLMYFYTPLCGTCLMASKMLEVVQKLYPKLPLGKADLNYMPGLAEGLEITSVPCLLLISGGEIVEKIYAFHSVPFLHEQIQQKIL